MVSVKVTMPAPPPRLNRPTSAVNSPAMSGAGKRDPPPSLKPPSPEHDEPGRGGVFFSRDESIFLISSSGYLL